MDFARQQRDPTRHLIAITCVVLIHGLVIYGLVTGLARKAVEVIKKPLNATIVEELKAPPPPPPPPKKIEIPKPPPPPTYIPPPDVPVTVTPSENVITAVTPSPTPPPPAPVIAPPPPAPPPPAPKPALVKNANPLSRDCYPSMPAEAQRRNIEGTVVADLSIDEHGNVTEVKIVKSPSKILDRAVMNSISECKFQARGDKWTAEQEIEFVLQ